MNLDTTSANWKTLDKPNKKRHPQRHLGEIFG